MNRIFSVAVVLVALAAGSLQAGEPVFPIATKRVGPNLLIVDPKVVPLQQYTGTRHREEGPPALSVQPLPAPAAPETYDIIVQDRITTQLRPSELVVMQYHAASGSFSSPQEEPPGTLTQTAWDAVALAPDWLKTELLAKFSRLPTLLQNDYGKLMTEAEDPKYLDELAFIIANTTVVDLTHEYLRPRYLADQVKFLYAAAPQLGYVKIKEYGEPGVDSDFWTTTVYTMTEDGVEKEWELPRDYYYWWIVHPRLDGEPLHDIRPDTGKFAGYPLALTYKEFYLFNPEATKNYMDHYVFRDPPPYDKGHKGLQEIPIEDWQDWGPSSRGAFTDLVIGPNHITRDSLGRTTTIEFKIRQKGVILATTLLLEKGYADGNCDALETFIRYGAGNTPAVAEHPHVIVMDEAPFGLDGLIESVLDDFDVNYTVITSAELPEYDLTGVRKVIIPSDQPLALYQAIADNRDKLEEWLKTNWNILQIQGAVSSVDKDWSGIIMPGGFTVEGVADEDDDVVTVEGQPPLTRIIANTTSVWDNQEWNLSGDRLYDPDTFAIDKVTFWSSQNIWDSIGDFAAKHPWFPPERAVQAVRVAFNHYGNCGENQDIVTAASRTCLIPASNTNNGPEDHVWSEFYINDGWHTYQIGWSDDGANIDNPGISSGARHGGGKNNSFIVQYRGDGKLNNRTDYYHYTGDLIVNVVDPEGHPIQGAWVLIGTETFYKVDGEYPLTIGFWDFTDENGQVTIQLGANVVDDLETNCYDQETEYRCNSYYMKVLTYAGEYPAGSEQIKDWAHVVEYEEAFPDFTKEITVEVAGVFPSYRPSQVTDTAQETIPEKAIKVTLDETVEMVCGLGAIAGRYCDAYADGTIDFYVLDQANFDKLAAGEPFDALAAEEDVGTEFEFLASAPANEDWYLLLAHQYRFQHDMLINARFEVLEGTPPAADDPAIADGPPAEDLTEQPQDDSAAQPNDADTEPDAASSGEGGKKKKGSCSAGNHSEANGLGLILLLLLGGLMVILRRRSGSFIA